MKARVQPLQLNGTHKEIGRGHGEEHRELIREFLELLRENVAVRVRVRAGPKLTQDLVRKHWAYSAEYDPDLAEEVKGIAEGSGLTIMNIVFLNAFLDLVNARDSRIAARLLGCTSFGASLESTVDSKCYIGQNYDMEAFYRRFMTLLEVSATNKPSGLVYTYTGIVGCAGLNSAGIGLCTNFLHPTDATYGVVYPFVVRKILSQVRIGDAIGAATIGYRAGGINLLVGDELGSILDVETSARDHDILFPDRGVIAHANHYISPRMQKYDLIIWDPSYDSAIERRGSTIMRWYSADRKLREHIGAVSVEVLKEVACDHTNHPYSICLHGDPKESDLLRGETNASMILDPKERRMLLAVGCPCEGEYTEFVLKE